MHRREGGVERSSLYCTKHRANCWSIKNIFWLIPSIIIICLTTVASLLVIGSTQFSLVVAPPYFVMAQHRLLREKYFMIDQQIAPFYALQWMSLTTLTFYATQIISPFLTSRISANHNKGLGFKPVGKSLYSLMFL